MSSVVASGVTEHRSVPPDGHNLKLRVFSALVLAPLALGAVYAGFPWFEILVALAAALMAREWATLSWMIGAIGSSSAAMRICARPSS